MTILTSRGQRMKVVIDEDFIAKKWKFENFEQNKCYLHQKKLRTFRIQIQIEIEWLFGKETKIFLIFSPKGGPFGVKTVDFYFSIFQSFIIFFSKTGLLGPNRY